MDNGGHILQWSDLTFYANPAVVAVVCFFFALFEKLTSGTEILAECFSAAYLGTSLPWRIWYLMRETAQDGSPGFLNAARA